MKDLVVGLVSALALALVVALVPGLTRPSLAAGVPYEVWVIDQADAARGGAKLYIYRGSQLESGQLMGDPEVVDLQAAATDVGDGPGVRSHLLTFNTAQTHALIANVTSGHVYFMRAADRKIVASIDVGEQAHAAYASPDDSFVMVANQNGKKLARIATDFGQDAFRWNPAEDLNLKALEDPGHPDNAPICPIVFTDGGKKAYVTLRGGGLYVVDAASTPMKVLQSYNKDQIAPGGCGGVAVGNKVYVNSGTATSSDLYVFDGTRDVLVRHIPFTPLGKDGHGMTLLGRYLWMGNRASGNIVVVDTATDTNVSILADPGAAPDIMEVSPNGDYVFVVLRGPNNLTGGPPAKGKTPGFVVYRVDAGGAGGAPALFVPLGDQSADSPNDPHALAVRRLAAEPAPAALPRTGDGLADTAMALAALAGALLAGVGAFLRRKGAPSP